MVYSSSPLAFVIQPPSSLVENTFTSSTTSTPVEIVQNQQKNARYAVINYHQQQENSFNPFLSTFLTANSVDDDEQIVSSSTASTTTKAWTEKDILNLPSSSKLLRRQEDEVARVIDANTIKLKKADGLITFATVQTPSGYSSAFQFPECMSKSPSSKVRQLIPPGTKVNLYYLTSDGTSDGNNKRRALVVKKETGAVINMELVREGFARPSMTSTASAIIEKELPGWKETLTLLQNDAKANGVGMYKNCDDRNNIEEMMIASDDQFEELDYTVQTKWGDDGGKQILVERESSSKASEIPKNPGDRRGCSDFEVFEDALRYYDKYYPYYGDVARLDRDGDGVPCSGLPHTTNPEKYRMKKPTVFKSQ